MTSVLVLLLALTPLSYGGLLYKDTKLSKAVNWTNPCESSPLKGTPTCDTTKSFEERAHDLVYNQETKSSDKGASIYASISGNTAAAVPSLNISAYQWWSEALHGVAGSPGVSYHSPIMNSTMFPQVITTGCTFNASLFHMIGQTIATEARAMNNYKQAGLTFWAPNINIFRDPRWGRGQETPGEDPFLTSTYAKEFVSGMEGHDPKYIKASSCCKHYADYNKEGGRTSFNAIVNHYDQNDTYLVAFKYCAIAGNASGVMCSYNAENGIPSCANKYLMTTLLRETWNFYGYITSDCGAVNDVQNAHHYTNNTGDTVNDVFSSGMDVDCGSYTQTNMVSALKSNAVSMETIQGAMYNLALVQMRLGMFDDIKSTPWADLGPNDVSTPQHLNLSRDAARQGMVLLKNTDNILPIKTKPTPLALIGPNADQTAVLKGNYYGTPPFMISVMDGIAMYVEKSYITYQHGVDIDSQNASGIPAAVNTAKTADLTIMVMGLDQSQEREGHDRGNVALPGLQNNLTEQVAAAAGGDVVLVILSGGCVDISQQKANPKIKAIIYGGYSGMFGGEAVADVIFGGFNPTGRLDQTWYYNNYTQQVSMSDMNMRPNVSTNNPGRGYRYFGGDVVYRFGDGMSFTSFTCSAATEKNGEIMVDVKNSGNVWAGGAVVLVYFVPNNGGSNGIEIKRLIAFGRADMLATGQQQTLNMGIYPEFLHGEEHKNMNGKYVVSCMGDM